MSSFSGTFLGVLRRLDGALVEVPQSQHEALIAIDPSDVGQKGRFGRFHRI